MAAHYMLYWPSLFNSTSLTIAKIASSDYVWMALKTQVSTSDAPKLRMVLRAPVGVAPTDAVRLLQQLQLFPVVFAPPPELEQRLGTSYGLQCVEVVAAAETLTSALNLQVNRLLSKARFWFDSACSSCGG